GIERPQVAQRVLGVGRAAAVDVHPADREPGVGRRSDDRHQVAVLGGGDIAMVFLPRLPGRHEHHFVELEQAGDLAGRDQVAIVDGIERPTHYPQPSTRSHKEPAYGSANTRSDRREPVGRWWQMPTRAAATSPRASPDFAPAGPARGEN